MSLIASEAAELLRARIRVPDSVVYRAFPAETVVLNLDTGYYHGLNPTAARMLETLESSPSVADALARLTTEFPVSETVLRDDLLALCGQLIERGLVVREAAP